MNKYRNSNSSYRDEYECLPCRHCNIDPSDPNKIPKYIDPLPIPEIAEYSFNNEKDEGFRIFMTETFHRFQSYFPKTKVWRYNGRYPGPTIKAFKNRTTYIKWENHLPEKHILSFDSPLHRTIDSPEVKIVVHVQGAHVEPEGDTYPEAWFTRNYALTEPSFIKKVCKYTNHQPATTL